METKGIQKNDGENTPKSNLKSWKKLWLFSSQSFVVLHVS